jgi:hypothetical protein
MTLIHTHIYIYIYTYRSIAVLNNPFLCITAFLASPRRFLIGQINPFPSGLTSITSARAQLFRDSILSSNGAVHLIGETLASCLTMHQALPTFDVCWTAFQQAFNKHHLDTCATHSGAINTGNRDLIHSLVSAYGQDTAAFIVSRSHRLPFQYVHLA